MSERIIRHPKCLATATARCVTAVLGRIAVSSLDIAPYMNDHIFSQVERALTHLATGGKIPPLKFEYMELPRQQYEGLLTAMLNEHPAVMVVIDTNRKIRQEFPTLAQLPLHVLALIGPVQPDRRVLVNDVNKGEIYQPLSEIAQQSETIIVSDRPRLCTVGTISLLNEFVSRSTSTIDNIPKRHH